jgi:hypothetical protein
MFWKEKKSRFRIADDVEVRARVREAEGEPGYEVTIPTRRRRWIRALDAWFAAARTPLGGNYKRDVFVQSPELGVLKLTGAFPTRRTIREKGKAMEYLILCDGKESMPKGVGHAV